MARLTLSNQNQRYLRFVAAGVASTPPSIIATAFSTPVTMQPHSIRSESPQFAQMGAQVGSISLKCVRTFELNLSRAALFLNVAFKQVLYQPVHLYSVDDSDKGESLLPLFDPLPCPMAFDLLYWLTTPAGLLGLRVPCPEFTSACFASRFLSRLCLFFSLRFEPFPWAACISGLGCCFEATLSIAVDPASDLAIAKPGAPTNEGKHDLPFEGAAIPFVSLHAKALPLAATG